MNRTVARVPFVAVAIAVYATALVIIRTPAFAARPDLLGFGVATDLAVGIPLEVALVGYGVWRAGCAVLGRRARRCRWS